jgi:tetratricopeptide repeat protein
MENRYASCEDAVGAYLVITENVGNLYKGVILYGSVGADKLQEFSFYGNSKKSVEWYRRNNTKLSPFADIPSGVRLFTEEFSHEVSDSIYDVVHKNTCLSVMDTDRGIIGANFKLPKGYDFTYDKSAIFEYDAPKNEPYIEPKADLSAVEEWVKVFNEKFGCRLVFNSELGVLYNEGDYLSELAQGEAETTVPLWVNDGKKRLTVAEPNLSVEGSNGKFDLTIPEGVRAIGAGAFTFLRNRVSKLYLPDSLVEIGLHAFFGCGIEDVSFGSSLVSIGAGAFAYNCFSKVVLPPSLVEVGMGCFNGNDKLSSLEIYRTGLRLVQRSAIENLKDSDKYSVASGSSATVKVSSQVISLTGTKYPKIFRKDDYNYIDRYINVVSEIASIELCRELKWDVCALTTAQVLARESAKDRKAWSKYTGSSKQGSTVAKKSESPRDTKRTEVLQELEGKRKLGTKGSAETISYLKSLLATLTGAEE